MATHAPTPAQRTCNKAKNFSHPGAPPRGWKRGFAQNCARLLPRLDKLCGGGRGGCIRYGERIASLTGVRRALLIQRFVERKRERTNARTPHCSDLNAPYLIHGKINMEGNCRPSTEYVQVRCRWCAIVGVWLHYQEQNKQRDPRRFMILPCTVEPPMHPRTRNLAAQS